MAFLVIETDAPERVAITPLDDPGPAVAVRVVARANCLDNVIGALKRISAARRAEAWRESAAQVVCGVGAPPVADPDDVPLSGLAGFDAAIPAAPDDPGPDDDGTDDPDATPIVLCGSD